MQLSQIKMPFPSLFPIFASMFGVAGADDTILAVSQISYIQ